VAPPRSLEITKQAGAAPSRLALRGELDMASAPRLSQQIEELVHEGHRRIEIDFSEVSFMDSSALGALLGARRLLVGEQSSLVLRGLTPNLMKIFEATGLADYFEFG
jgi:anti-sigma B factor antagonist